MTDICYLPSSVIRYRSLSRYLRRSALRCTRRSSCGFGCLPGRNSQTEETVGSESAIAWLTNAPTRLRRWICCRAILLLRPSRAIQLGGVAVEFNGLVDDPVQPWRHLSFPDAPKLCRGGRVAMSTGVLEIWYFPIANMRSAPCARGSAQYFCCTGLYFSTYR